MGNEVLLDELEKLLRLFRQHLGSALLELEPIADFHQNCWTIFLQNMAPADFDEQQRFFSLAVRVMLNG